MATRTLNFAEVSGSSYVTVTSINPSRRFTMDATTIEQQSTYITPLSIITFSTGSSSVSSTILYKLRGYNAVTQAFESWVSSNPYSSPPSGATLIDITVQPLGAI